MSFDICIRRQRSFSRSAIWRAAHNVPSHPKCPGNTGSSQLTANTVLFFSPPMAPMLSSSPYAAGSSVPPNMTGMSVLMVTRTYCDRQQHGQRHAWS